MNHRMRTIVSKPVSQRPVWQRWYGLAKWQRRRLAQLKAHPLCVFCAALGIVTPATVADHVVPHRGSAHRFWHGELQSLCKLCHDKAKQAEEHRGYLPDVGLDGYPVDPRHPFNTGAGASIATKARGES
jgi:5-methylcytosine-specific restriction enzyme A